MLMRPAKSLEQLERVEVGVEHALRTVLVVALNRDEAALLVGRWHDEDAVTLWPSTVYGCVTRQMLASRASWTCGAASLDRRLSPWLERFETRSAIELAQAMSEGRDAWDAQELAAVLWALLRRNDPALEVMLRRMAAEIEIAVLQMSLRPHREAPTGRRTTTATVGNHRRAGMRALAST